MAVENADREDTWQRLYPKGKVREWASWVANVEPGDPHIPPWDYAPGVFIFSARAVKQN